MYMCTCIFQWQFVLKMLLIILTFIKHHRHKDLKEWLLWEDVFSLVLGL